MEGEKKEAGKVKETKERKEVFYQQADPMLYGVLKEYARENRKGMTDAERELWRYLKNDALGLTFLRQYIIGQYIVDFACLKDHLIIEVDGGYHSEPRQAEDDKVRQRWLEEQGYTVIRFKNEEIEFDINKVIGRIKTRINPRSLP